MVNRTKARKRVPILSGEDGTYSESSYVDIPVIVEFDILGSLGQAFRYRLRNDSGSESRDVVVKKVGSAKGDFDTSVTTSTSKYANVERIQTMAFKGSLDSGLYWQTNKKLKNLDPAPKQPDGSNDPRHFRVHYVRFYKDNNTAGSTWIDTEVIDELLFLGSRGQEYHYRLRHPTATQYAEAYGDPFGTTKDDDQDPYQPIVGYCSPSLPLLPVEFDEDTGKPVPTRTDPFQNIVNVNGGRAGMFLAADGWGTLYVSRDGLTWATQQTEMGATAPSLNYGNGQWVILGTAYLDQSDDGSQVWVSSDGYTWEKKHEETTPLLAFVGWQKPYPTWIFGEFLGYQLPFTQLNTWYVTTGHDPGGTASVTFENPFPTLPGPNEADQPHPSFGFLDIYEVKGIGSALDPPDNITIFLKPPLNWGTLQGYGYEWGDVDSVYYKSAIAPDGSTDGAISIALGSGTSSAASGGTTVGGQVVYVRMKAEDGRFKYLEATTDNGQTWQTVCTCVADDPLYGFNWGFSLLTFQEPGTPPAEGAAISCGSMASPQSLTEAVTYNASELTTDLEVAFSTGALSGPTLAHIAVTFNGGVVGSVSWDSDVANIEQFMLDPTDHNGEPFFYWTRSWSGNPNGGNYEGSANDGVDGTGNTPTAAMVTRCYQAWRRALATFVSGVPAVYEEDVP